MCVPEILQLRVAAQAWNNTSKYGPYCELFCFLMRHEPGDGEAVVCSLLGLYGYMLTDSTGVEPYGGKTKGLRAKGESIAQEEALCTSAPHAHADSSLKRAPKTSKTRPALASAIAELICTRIVTVLCDETVRCQKMMGKSDDEVDNDGIEVVSVSSHCHVVPCFPSLDSSVPVDLLTNSGCMCFPCCP